MLWVLSSAAMWRVSLLLSYPVPIPCSTHRPCCLLLSPWGHIAQLCSPVSPSNGIPQQGHDQESPPGWL